MDGVVLHHPPVADEAAVALRRIFCRIGDHGEIIAQRGQVTGHVIGATEQGVTVTDDGNNYFVPFSEIKLFIRSGAEEGDDNDDDAPAGEREHPRRGSGSEMRPARRPPPASIVRRSGDAIEKVKLLGQGAQGQVWKARYASAPMDQFIVVKEMLFTHEQRQQMNNREQQARRIMQLRHEHLIEYVDVLVEEHPAPCVKVVMPYYKESDMLGFVTGLTKPLTEFKICSLILQVASALDYLHTLSPPMVHRDVKLENILMFDNTERTMLMDLDMSREMTKRATPGRITMCGTYEYMAPEVERFEGSPKSDVWSLGIVLLVLLTLPDCLTLKKVGGSEDLKLNSAAWTQGELNQSIRTAVDKLRQRTGVAYSAELVNLCCTLLSHDLSRRYTAEQAVLELQDLMVATLTGVPAHSNGRNAAAAAGSRHGTVPAPTQAVANGSGSESFNLAPRPRGF